MAGARRGYERYYASGLYDRRYPAPNRLTWARLNGWLPRDGDAVVLDYGCGSGRYVQALLADSCARIVAYDIAEAALSRLAERLVGPARQRVTLAGPGFADLDGALAQTGPPDLILMLFGVLAHMPGRDQRRACLSALAERLARGGRMVVSVPSRRRFALAQLRQGGQDIWYRRTTPDGDCVALPYHLYTPGELRADLAAAGLAPAWLRAESLLPEAALCRSAAWARVEAGATRLLPAGLGYGLLAGAGPA